MTTLFVSQSKNYRFDLLNGIDAITFTNPVLSSATAVFAANQFDGAPISTAVAITGNAGINRIVVNFGTVDASQWSFASWESTSDTVTFNGMAGADAITGSDVADTINAGSRADTIEGGLGADVLNGEAGNDSFVFNHTSELPAAEIVNGGDGAADKIVLLGANSFDFAPVAVSGIERLELLGGNVLAEFLPAQFGAGGIASVKGPAGVQWLWITGSATDLSGVAFGAWDAAEDRITLRGLDNVINSLTGSARGDTIDGRQLADVLTGNEGNDRITGGGSADTMAGGPGNDTFVYINPGDIAPGEVLSGGGGSADAIALGHNSGTYHLELLSFSGIEQIEYSGDGNSATVDGSQMKASGIDRIIGGVGTDALQVGGSIDLSQITFEAWTASDTITVLGGLADSDTIIGSAFKDTIMASGGDDLVRGGAGGDTLAGGGGTDTLSYAGSAAGVTVNLLLNTASGGDAAGDVIGDFENLTGSSSGDVLTGDADANSIAGGGGGDTITGGLGADDLDGGGGNDWFVVNLDDELADQEAIDGGGGTLDTIQLGADPSGYSFFQSQISGVERLVFTGGALATLRAEDFGGGAGLIHEVTGSGGQNSLVVAGANADLSGTVIKNWDGLLGGDIVMIVGDPGDETIFGSNAADQIIGFTGADTIDGGDGADLLLGGLGQDFLTGGASADRFMFEAANESAIGASRDRITDFDQGTDLIDFSNFDAIPGGAFDPFVFINQSSFTVGEAGRLRYVHTASDNTVIEGEINGDGVADFQIQINGKFTLGLADLVI